ncbi:MAG: hypothetical protein IT249_21015 [Chitinophagaceae bacterium]|nr:hypothetical protein [Chitinophagaceae bacterium]
MKTLQLLILLAFLSAKVYCQTEVQNIATFCKLWGFLKYYHPTIAKGKIDWDNEFLTRVTEVSRMKNKKEVSNYFLSWIESLGEIQRCNRCPDSLPEYVAVNYNMEWLHDSTAFTTELIKKLSYILKNRNQKKNYYTPFKKVLFIQAASMNYETEKAYADSIYPSTPLRLLTLSRYWNIVNYFFPYKYAIGRNWDTVLSEMVPKFKDAVDTLSYHLSILELAASINDSHSRFFYTPQTLNYFGDKAPIFEYTIIKDKAVVTGFYNDSLSKIDDIKYGDIILKINQRPLKEIIDEKGRYISASNQDCRIRDMKTMLLNGNKDSATIEIERNGLISEKTVHRYPLWYLADGQNKKNIERAWKLTNDNIGYVNMGILQYGEIDDVMKELTGAKAIIFDLRNYPKSLYPKLSNYLNAERKPFVRFTMPMVDFPGMYAYSKDHYTGKKNKFPFQGLTVLLIDERTQSMAELTVMALQTASNVTLIGNHTAGADGDVVTIPLPGGYRVSMSSIGVYYPDGKETQRIGITPDVEIRPTIEGLRKGKDEVFEEVIRYINSHPVAHKMTIP